MVRILPKHKTTIQIDDKLWKSFLSFIIKKHGTTKRISIEIETAMKEYLNHHSGE